MTYPTTFPPNIADFVSFIENQMGVPPSALSDDPTTDPDVITAFCVAKENVSRWFIYACFPLEYNLAVYNYAGDYLINWANDQTCSTFFTDLRAKWNITGFVAGVVNSTADESTSTSLTVPDAFSQLQIGDLQMLKTPYGRAYLAIAQKMGSIWGIS